MKSKHFLGLLLVALFRLGKKKRKIFFVKKESDEITGDNNRSSFIDDFIEK
jgi:hypothetical protein